MAVVSPSRDDSPKLEDSWDVDMKRGGVGGRHGEVEEDRGGVEEAEEVALGGTGGVEARVPDDALAAAANVLALRSDSVKGDSSNDMAPEKQLR